jgi:ribonuclease BN (tRNA processing enzyme)
MREQRGHGSATKRTSRRRLLQNTLAVLGAGAAARWLQPSVVDALPAQAAAAATSPASSQLILLGTQGGPVVNLQRGETASALVTANVPYLVDCGYGTLRALTQAGIRLTDIATLFITHLHDDHTADIAALLSHKWAANPPGPLTAYGPFGTSATIRGAIAFANANTEIRTIDEGRTARPELLFTGKDLTAVRVTEVFRDEHVTVRAVENTHFPERARAKMAYRSLAYRFTMPDRSIVFSGDTAYSPALVELAKDADVLVCEAIDTTVYAELLKAAEAAPGGLNVDSVPHHIIETHSTTEDVGRMAAEARVRTVVLNHLVPGSNPARGGPIPDERYIQGVRKYFSGRVIVGADQMRI